MTFDTFDQSDEETRLKKIFDKDIDKTKSMAATKTILKTCDRALRRGQFCTLFCC